MKIEVPERYESLAKVLQAAMDQAAKGKGLERHVINNEPFNEQFICEIARGLNSPAGPLQNAIKKAYESQKLGGQRGIAELLGAINYMAAAVIIMQEKENTAYNQAAQIDLPFNYGGKIGTGEKTPLNLLELINGLNCESNKKDANPKKVAGGFSIKGPKAVICGNAFDDRLRMIERMARNLFGKTADIVIEVSGE